MKNKFVSLLVITLLLCCMFLVGCDKDSSAPTTDTSIENSEESGIQMDQYLTLYLEGLDGYGYLGTIMDLEQLKEDCKNHLITDEADLPYRHTQNATIEDYLDEVFSHLEATDFIERKSADGQLKKTAM